MVDNRRRTLYNLTIALMYAVSSHLSSLDVPDVDTLILVEGDGLAFGGHLHLHRRNIFQWSPDHPAVPRQSLSSLHSQEKKIQVIENCNHMPRISITWHILLTQQADHIADSTDFVIPSPLYSNTTITQCNLHYKNTFTLSPCPDQ